MGMIKKLLCSAAVAACLPTTIVSASTSEILWDKWGIPHIYADNLVDAYYAQGRAMAHSHGDLILKLYGEARGRSAEYWGAKTAERDKTFHRLGVANWGETAFQAQRPDMKAAVAAFAKGVNDYAAANPDAISAEMKQVLPVTGADIMAHYYRIFYVEFAGKRDLAMPYPMPRADVKKAALDNLGDTRQAMKVDTPYGKVHVGSNTWAVGPQKSASGNAMVLSNPHLPWFDFFTFYESQIETKDDFFASGVTLVGLPGWAIAFNKHLGWSHTVNGIDLVDRYDLTLKNGGYVLDGAVKSFETKMATIKIKQDDGSVRSESFEIKNSIHGPVIKEAEGHAMAIKFAGTDRYHVMSQYTDMLRAKNLDGFLKALDQQQLPYFNIMYGDDSGEIYYISNGYYPKRPVGGYQFWEGLIPGDDSRYLWQDIYPQKAIPQLRNPKAGAAQNANDTPWTSTMPMELRKTNYPDSFAGPEFAHFRAQHSLRMLMGDDSITWDEMHDYQQSTTLDVADHILDDLIPAAEASGDALIQEAGKVLAQWNRKTNADDVGGVLFSEFFNLSKGDLFSDAWDMNRPYDTPTVPKDLAKAVATLKQAAENVKTKWGRLTVPWGEVYRLRRNGVDLPANGQSGALGSFRIAVYRQDKDGKYAQFHGDTYVAVTEFAKDGVRARGLLSYGNASQKGSPHNGDQLTLYSQKKWRDIPVTRAAVEAITVRHEKFN